MGEVAKIIAEAQEEQKRPQFEPGWHRDIPNEIYHRSSGWSSSTLKKFIEKSPAHVQWDMRHPSPQSESMALGSAVHTLILEPEKFEQEFAVSQKFDGRTNAGKEGKARFLLEAGDKTVLNEEQYNAARIMSDKVRNHDIAGIFVNDVVCESSIYWWYRAPDDDDSKYRMMMKVRPDAISRSHPVMIDVKTTTNAGFSEFMKTIHKYAYHLSAAMYLKGANQCQELLDHLGYHAITNFLFVVVENVPPYEVAVYELSDRDRELGLHLFQKCARRLRDSLAEGFTAYPMQIRQTELPSWADRNPVI